tara:strand:- start:568 stop:1176 length:609 start_codon:yes stop_codon:yes gene_type:complete
MFIAFICLIVVIKTDRLFKISSHQGIRYFRNAFFFYGVAFVLRYLLNISRYYDLIKAGFQFFMIMAGFFLLYSLLWKRFENKEGSKSSFFNSRIFIFYILTIIIILLDYFWASHNFMIFSQIILFSFASIISFNNYKEKGKEHKFLKLYFLVMILSFFAWSFNFIFSYFFDRLRWLANVYILNIIVFLIFLYGVIKVTQKGA